MSLADAAALRRTVNAARAAMGLAVAGGEVVAPGSVQPPTRDLFAELRELALSMPPRAYVSCACGRHVLCDLADALREACYPCPDCHDGTSRRVNPCGGSTPGPARSA